MTPPSAPESGVPPCSTQPERQHKTNCAAPVGPFIPTSVPVSELTLIGTVDESGNFVSVDPGIPLADYLARKTAQRLDQQRHERIKAKTHERRDDLPEDRVSPPLPRETRRSRK